MSPRSAAFARGFTLIELMIVVAIIGILAAIAIPSFGKMLTRARQTEAKISLKAFFTSAKSYYAEKGRWKCGMCGWAPQDKNYIYNYFIDTNLSFTAGKQGCTDTDLLKATQTDPTGVDPGGFTVGAAANIDSDVTCDGWTINNSNDLDNSMDDVEM
jgi:prepilin-type N-terminal cleavage/methylation domain-containing protein